MTDISYFIILFISSLCVYGQKQNSLKEFALKYINDLTAENWEEIVVDKYGWKDIKVHKEFREAFTDYKVEVIHIVTNDAEGIIWGKVTAKHMMEFPHGELKGLPPTGKEVSWLEWRLQERREYEVW